MPKDGQDNITDTIPEDLGGGDPGGGVDPDKELAEDPLMAGYIEDILPYLPLEVYERLQKTIAQVILFPGEEVQKAFPNAFKVWKAGTEARNAFILSLTAEDFVKQYSDSEIPEKIKEVFTSGTDAEKLEAFGHLPPLVFFELCESKQGRKRVYRTKSKAGETLNHLPAAIAVPTLKTLQYATSFHQKGNAYLQRFTTTDGLLFKDGNIYFRDARPISEAQLQNIKTKEGIQEIDLGLLRIFYSIALQDFEDNGSKAVKPEIVLYLPDLAAYMGKSRKLNADDTRDIIEKVQKFHNIVGVFTEQQGNRERKSYYAVLNFNYYDDKKNTISFSSPYMNHVIATAYNLSIRKDNKGTPRLKKNGEPQKIATHSYLIKPEISKERNKKAAENVVIIVQLIEQAGDNVPRIRAATLIERNAQLAQALEESSNKRQLLQRVFKKTWEILPHVTKLREVYTDIQLPDPNNPRNIPTPKNIDSLVFEFPHKGKKQTTEKK